MFGILLRDIQDNRLEVQLEKKSEENKKNKKIFFRLCFF